MLNPPIKAVILQAEGQYCKFDLVPGMLIEVGPNGISVRTDVNPEPFRFGRTAPDPVAMLTVLTASIQDVQPGPDGVTTWTALAGATVSAERVRIQWQGKSGAALPSVDGMDDLLIFTEANRVENV